MTKKFDLIIKSEDDRNRIDIVIKKYNPLISRNRIKNLILKYKLKINSKINTDPSKKILTNDKISLEISEPKLSLIKPYDYKLDVIFEDDDIIVVNKPAGIVMHPGLEIMITP